MGIKGFVDLSLVDWDGKVCSVIFLPSCNLRCPFCYNTALVLHPEKLPTIPLEEVEDYLKEKHGWIDGVVVTGGEPTIHDDLPSLCQKINELGLLVKVDTNGTHPAMIKELVKEGLINSIAMDIKAPLTEEKYSRASGVNAKALLKNIKETMNALLELKIECEFRTTTIPTVHEKEDIEQICQTIRGCKKYVIQNYKGDVETIDPSLKNLKPFSEEKMREFLITAQKIVPNTLLRG